MGEQQLATRGIVAVSARRGWELVEPSQDEAREAFDARRVVETGLIRNSAGIKADDVGVRIFLLGDFHVCLAECLGNSLLADTLRDFIARTTLTAMLDLSSHERCSLAPTMCKSSRRWKRVTLRWQKS